MFTANLITIDVGECKVTFKRAGMMLYYDLIKQLVSIIPEEIQREELNELERLKNLGDKRKEPESKRFAELMTSITNRNIEGDILSRNFVMNLAVSIDKNEETGDAQDAKDYLDSRDSLTIAEIVDKIKPDLEKNSPSQS